MSDTPTGDDRKSALGGRDLGRGSGRSRRDARSVGRIFQKDKRAYGREHSVGSDGAVRSEGQQNSWNNDRRRDSQKWRDGHKNDGGWSRDGQSNAPRGSGGARRRDASGGSGRLRGTTASGGVAGGGGGSKPGGGRAVSGRAQGNGRSDDGLWTREGRPARGDRSARNHDHQSGVEAARLLRSVRPRHNDPDIAPDVEAGQLAKEARVELKTLSKDNAEEVARHLVMASRLMETDPKLAHRHALSAARRAGRIGIVRETLAITAYATGDFALALRELRTYRRITGSNDQIALMVDSERGIGRPDRALELGRSINRSLLPIDVYVYLAIAMSGARLDLGQEREALAELEISQLDPNRAFSWSPDLFHAYAEVLESLGRDADATTWRERAERAERALQETYLDAERETVQIVEEYYEVKDELPDGTAATEE